MVHARGPPLSGVMDCQMHATGSPLALRLSAKSLTKSRTVLKPALVALSKRSVCPGESPEARVFFGCAGGGMDLESASRPLLPLVRLAGPFFGVSGWLWSMVRPSLVRLCLPLEEPAC